MSKKTVAILCGGQSVEHEVSLMSAKNVYADVPETFNKLLIYISREGQWFWVESVEPFWAQSAEAAVALSPLLLHPGVAHPFVLKATGLPLTIDCVFPVLHGTYGEDGTMQGLLELLNVPYVGCQTVSAAVCMEKHLTKTIVRQHNIPTLDWVMIDAHHSTQYSYADLVARLGEPLFIKPTRLGSALGVSKVSSADAYHAALLEAFQVDHRVIVEPAFDGREIELSVIGNENPVASLPGEVIVHDDFYTYDAKYFDDDKADVVSPAVLSQETVAQLQTFAVDAYRALLCCGMARVDFFLRADGEIVLNEVNPIPGFTEISLYPKNWAASGLSYVALINQLINLALQAHQQKQQLQLMPSSKRDKANQS